MVYSHLVITQAISPSPGSFNWGTEYGNRDNWASDTHYYKDAIASRPFPWTDIQYTYSIQYTYITCILKIMNFH